MFNFCSVCSLDQLGSKYEAYFTTAGRRAPKVFGEDVTSRAKGQKPAREQGREGRARSQSPRPKSGALLIGFKKTLHRFAPEARRELAGGATTGIDADTCSERPGGAPENGDSICGAAFPASLHDAGKLPRLRFRWLHHRLISLVPSGHRSADHFPYTL